MRAADQARMRRMDVSERESSQCRTTGGLARPQPTARFNPTDNTGVNPYVNASGNRVCVG